MWGTGVLQVLILSVFFWCIGMISQQFLAFREFQKSSKKGRRIDVCDKEVKIQEENEQKGTQTWRGVFVLVLFWWCSICSSAAKHGTSSHTSYWLCAVIWHCMFNTWYKLVLLLSSPSVLLYLCEARFTNHTTHLVVSPEMRQSIWIHHSEHKVVLVFPSDVFSVTIITQQLVYIVPQQSALWSQKWQKSC